MDASVAARTTPTAGDAERGATSWGMIGATQVLLARQLGEVLRQDAQLYLALDAGPGVVRERSK